MCEKKDVNWEALTDMEFAKLCSKDFGLYIFDNSGIQLIMDRGIDLHNEGTWTRALLDAIV